MSRYLYIITPVSLVNICHPEIFSRVFEPRDATLGWSRYPDKGLGQEGVGDESQRGRRVACESQAIIVVFKREAGFDSKCFKVLSNC